MLAKVDNWANKAIQRTVYQSRYCYDAIPQNGLDPRPLIADVGQIADNLLTDNFYF